MTLSIDWGNTNIISVPKADLTLISGTLYQHDINAFRLELKGLEDSEEGVAFTKTHNHNTTVADILSGGALLARTVQIIAPYSIEYEDGAYSVNHIGANTNAANIQAGILVQNQVQVIPNNSAGLIVAGGGLTAAQGTQLLEIFQILGLDVANMLEITDTLRTAGAISQTIDETDPAKTVVTRI